MGIAKTKQQELEADRKHLEADELRPAHPPRRHDPAKCPLCRSKLAHRSGLSGRRPVYVCATCGACLKRELLCAHCNTHRVWRGKLGSACNGCGAKYSG